MSKKWYLAVPVPQEGVEWPEEMYFHLESVDELIPIGIGLQVQEWKSVQQVAFPPLTWIVAEQERIAALYEQHATLAAQLAESGAEMAQVRRAAEAHFKKTSGLILP